MKSIRIIVWLRSLGSNTRKSNCSKLNQFHWFYVCDGRAWTHILTPHHTILNCILPKNVCYKLNRNTEEDVLEIKTQTLKENQFCRSISCSDFFSFVPIASSALFFLCIRSGSASTCTTILIHLLSLCYKKSHTHTNNIK